MAGRPEDHFTDSRELYVLVVGDAWAHVEALDPDAGYWARRFAQLVGTRRRLAGEDLLLGRRSLRGRRAALAQPADELATARVRAAGDVERRLIAVARYRVDVRAARQQQLGHPQLAAGAVPR